MIVIKLCPAREYSSLLFHRRWDVQLKNGTAQYKVELMCLHGGPKFHKRTKIPQKIWSGETITFVETWSPGPSFSGPKFP